MFGRIFCVVLFDLAHAGFGEALVARVHFFGHLEERAGGEARVGDDVLDEVRDAVVDAQLDAFGIDHHHLHLIRRRADEQRGDDGVEADRLAGARCAGDEQMRHLAEIAENRPAGDVFAERHPERRHLSAIGQGVEDLANRDDRDGLIGNLDPDRRLAGNRCFDAHAGRGQRERDVVGQRGNARNLHAALGAAVRSVRSTGRARCA